MRLMSFPATPSFDRFIDLKSCASPKRGLQVECRSRPERLEQTPRPWRPRQPNKARGDCSVILSLQNNLVEAQTEQRCSDLAMLCQAAVAVGGRSLWRHRGPASYSALSSFSSASIFGGTRTPGGRMLAPLFPFALDTNANAKQEGSP
jgi:hypothetical protein